MFPQNLLQHFVASIALTLYLCYTTSTSNFEHYKKLWTSARAFIVTVSYSILFSFSLHTVFVKISFLFLFKSFSNNFVGFHNDRKCFRIYLFYHSFYRIHLLVIACTHDHVFFFTTIASYTFQNR